MTLFTDFAFPATGAPTPRTMPDRLAEVFNVKDFGALGNNVADDTTKIQAAMNAVLSTAGGRTPGGTLVFPAGRYKVSAPITFNLDADFGLHVLGVGNASSVEGNHAGYTFDRSLGTPNNTFGPRVFEHLKVTNPHSSGGGIRLGSTIGGAIRGCDISADLISLTFEDAPGSSSDSIVIDNCWFHSGVSSGTPKAIVFGGKGLVINACDITGYDDAITVYGSGVAIYGCRMESLNTSIVLGMDSAGADRGLHGFSITGMPMEGNVTFIDFRGTTTGFCIGSNGFTGHSGNAGLGSGVNTQYGLRLRANKALAGEFFGLQVASWFDVAGIYIEDYTVRANVIFNNCVSSIGGGAAIPWRVSTAPMGFRFIECNIDSSVNAPSGTRYTFANLPGGGIRLEGDEYDISDASTATLGAAASGGGANQVRVRWDGTSWIVIGP